MRELHSTLTTKGQVTIPVEIRRLLGLAPHDKVAFVVEDEQVRLTRRESVVQRTAGALKSTESPLSAEELRAAAEQVIAEDVGERMRW
jgi:AbrB family looped-hinge helix DNA binding protein